MCVSPPSLCRSLNRNFVCCNTCSVLMLWCFDFRLDCCLFFSLCQKLRFFFWIFLTFSIQFQFRMYRNIDRAWILYRYWNYRKIYIEEREKNESLCFHSCKWRRWIINRGWKLLKHFFSLLQTAASSLYMQPCNTLSALHHYHPSSIYIVFVCLS